MVRQKKGDYAVPGVVLLGAAATVILVATLTNRGDLTSATLFLCGFATFLAGIFMFSFSQAEPLDPRVASLLGVPGMVNQCRVCADLGVRGDAWFLPSPGGDGPIREFVPVGGNDLPGSLPDFSFVTGDGAKGVLFVPAASALLDYSEKELSLSIPSTEREVISAVRELCEDALELADRVEIVRDGDTLVMSVRGYRLSAGCRVIAGQSPKCCSMHPCGICSLVACILARGLNIPWQAAHVSLDEGKNTITVIYRSLPSHGPRGGGPGNSR
ncbi:MAG: hypothetical protein NQU46_04005 [Methanolinea sp.]|nr:hypothetical protein [Methanolinea sp.]